MDDIKVWMLTNVTNDNDISLGRNIYVTSIMLSYSYVYYAIVGNNAPLICYVLAFIMSGVLAFACQLKYYYFNNLVIGGCFRALLICTMMYFMYNITYIDLNDFSLISKPNPFRFFYCSTIFILLTFSLIGAALAFPFKMIAWANGFITGDLYIRNRPEQAIETIYNKYTETELIILRTKAEREDNYEEAKRINDFLTRKFPD